MFPGDLTVLGDSLDDDLTWLNFFRFSRISLSGFPCSEKNEFSEKLQNLGGADTEFMTLARLYVVKWSRASVHGKESGTCQSSSSNPGISLVSWEEGKSKSEKWKRGECLASL